MLIGENLKRLRAERGMTQEALAELLGISGQAVSRWESGAVCPDVSLLPGIANLFGVSLDELFGMESLRSPETLRGFFDRECKARADGDLESAESELRRGLRLFPGNHGLMSELALTLTRANRSCAEAIALSERVLAESSSSKLRATTAANLVVLYLRAGERERARELAGTLPHLRECRELMLCECADDRAGEPEACKSALRSAALECLRTLCELIEAADSRSRGELHTVMPMLADGPRCELSAEKALECVSRFILEK